MSEPIITRPPAAELVPVIVVAPRGFVHIGLTEARPLVLGMQNGKLPSHVALWDSRGVYRSSGAGGGLGGMAVHGPRDISGDRWGYRLGEPQDETPRLVELGDLHQMTDDAWATTLAWPVFRP